MTLRELVAAWRAQTVRVNAAFDAALAGINRELDAVGGYVTTTPNAEGYCQTYFRQDGTFGGGVSREGREDDPEYGPDLKPSQRDKAPLHPEVGDRCRELDVAWRGEAMAHTETMLAIRRVAMPGAKDSTDETLRMACDLAARLVDDEASERAGIVAWLRSDKHHLDKTGHDALVAAADCIERGKVGAQATGVGHGRRPS